jgi:hypothetical protein
MPEENDAVYFLFLNKNDMCYDDIRFIREEYI